MNHRFLFKTCVSLAALGLLASACPKVGPTEAAKPAVRAGSPGAKPKQKKKKKVKKPLQTLLEEEQKKSIYPCQEYRCEEAYRTFSVRHAAHQKPVGRAAVDRWRTQYKKKKAPKAKGLKGEALKEAIVEEMNIGFLLADLDAARSVRVAHERETGLLRETVLEVIDPHVGRFDVLLLEPRRSKGVPSAILALHGHGDNPETMARKYLGRQLAEQGHRVALPRLRAHECQRNPNLENEVAIDLWAHGFSLMGLHVYEALVTRRVAASHWKASMTKWGILGHSGGSSLSNLLTRVSSDFEAKVVDYFVDFNNRCGPERIHCETFGPLFPLANDINNEKTLGVAHMSVPYGYKKRKKAILTFFDKHLKR